MTYRPITDTWQLARPKLGGNSYYGAYPSGFLERACYLLGVNQWSRVLHVCSGALRDYHSGPTKGLGLGPLHKTIDLNDKLNPDFCMDVRKLGVTAKDIFPLFNAEGCQLLHPATDTIDLSDLWDAVLIDRPYTQEDHEHYDVPSEVFPSSLNDLLKRALSVVKPGGCVGVLDYLWPAPPSKQKFLPRWREDYSPLPDEQDKPATRLIATIQVLMGWNNRSRVYSVYQRIPTSLEADWMHTDALSAINMEAAIVKLHKQLESVKKQKAELQSDFEDAYSAEDIDTMEKELRASLEDDVVSPEVFDWAIDGGAHPEAAPPHIKDKLNAHLSRKAGYVWPSSPFPRMAREEKADLVDAVSRMTLPAVIETIDKEAPPTNMDPAMEGFS